MLQQLDFTQTAGKTKLQQALFGMACCATLKGFVRAGLGLGLELKLRGRPAHLQHEAVQLCSPNLRIQQLYDLS